MFLFFRSIIFIFMGEKNQFETNKKYICYNILSLFKVTTVIACAALYHFVLLVYLLFEFER